MIVKAIIPVFCLFLVIQATNAKLLSSNTNITQIQGLSKQLFQAIKENDSISVRSLLEQGANPNDGLMLASKMGQKETIEILISYGADPNIQYFGWTPLFVATIFGQLEAIETLIQSGANVNHQDMFGRTPLFMAVRINEPTAVEALLDAGANPYIWDMYGSLAMENPFQSSDIRQIFDERSIKSYNQNILIRIGLIITHEASRHFW